MKKIGIIVVIVAAILALFYFIGISDEYEQLPDDELPPITDNEEGNDEEEQPSIQPEEPEIPVIEEYVTSDEELYVYELIYADLSSQFETHTAFISLGYNEETLEYNNVYGIMYGG